MIFTHKIFYLRQQFCSNLASVVHPDINSIEEYLQPENEIELAIMKDPAFKAGLFWGKPRFGHPEGKIIYHIKEVFENINLLKISKEVRSQLRLIALVHDSFKMQESEFPYPRSKENHHASIAKRFSEKYIQEQYLLDIIEWHDEAYYAWRDIHIYREEEQGNQRKQHLINKMGEHLQLFYLFFKCDTKTGDKIQAPLIWFEKTIQNIDKIIL